MDESLNQEIAARAESGVIVFEPRRALAATWDWARERAASLACAALLSVMSLQMLAVISRKTVTVDEIVLIPAAYYHLAAFDCQLVNEHPPLVKILAAAPLLFVQPNEINTRKLDVPADSPPGKWAHAESFWRDNGAAFHSISFWARVPMILLSALTGLVVFALAREMFGDLAAVLAVALFTLEPTVLAHGRVVQTDVAASLGYLLTLHALRRYAHAPTPRRALLLGAAGGLACLAKFSMLLVAPLLGAVFAVLAWRAPREGRARKSVAAHAGLVLLAALVLINAAYFFDHRPLSPDDLSWLKSVYGPSGDAVVRAINALSYLLPTDFVFGVFYQAWHNRVGHDAGFLGMYRATGWWYYFPVAFALKTTLPFLLLSLASLAWGAREWLKVRDARFAWLLAPFAIYTAFVLFSNIDIGVRYYLPAYTFLSVLAGALLDRLLRSRRARRAGAFLAVALLCWVAVEAARAYPDHMSYMNQLASRAPHWWYLSDSNVEWGDDVGPLAEYLRARGETRVGGAFLGGFMTLRHYGVEYVDLLNDADEPAGRPAPRYTAIGASYLNGSTVPAYKLDGRDVTQRERVNTFDEYRRRKPEAIIGGSIYLFREDGR